MKIRRVEPPREELQFIREKRKDIELDKLWCLEADVMNDKSEFLSRHYIDQNLRSQSFYSDLFENLPKRFSVFIDFNLVREIGFVENIYNFLVKQLGMTGKKRTIEFLKNKYPDIEGIEMLEGGLLFYIIQRFLCSNFKLGRWI